MHLLLVLCLAISGGCAVSVPLQPQQGRDVRGRALEPSALTEADLNTACDASDHCHHETKATEVYCAGDACGTEYNYCRVYAKDPTLMQCFCYEGTIAVNIAQDGKMTPCDEGHYDVTCDCPDLRTQLTVGVSQRRQVSQFTDQDWQMWMLSDAGKRFKWDLASSSCVKLYTSGDFQATGDVVKSLIA